MTTAAPPLSIPPELKKITQYIRRAEELDRDRTYPESRLVAYYLRQFAAQIGIPLLTNIPSTPAGGSALVKKCLGEIINQLEAEKKAMSNFSKKEAQFLCRSFADRVLDKANGQDMAVMESVRLSPNQNLDSTMQQVFKDMAQAFYAAGTFYDILQQFYVPTTNEVYNGGTEDEEQKEENKRRLYCKFKATEILKALKEGRLPSQTEKETEVVVVDVKMQQSQRQPYVGSESMESSTQDVPFLPNVYVPPSPISAPPLPPTVRFDLPQVSYKQHVPPPPPVSSSTWTIIDALPLIPVPIVAPVQSNEEALPAPPSNNPALVYPTEPRRPGNNNGGLVNSSRGKQPVTKAQLTDARELTHFALAAIEAKDADLAAERLASALEALGR